MDYNKENQELLLFNKGDYKSLLIKFCKLLCPLMSTQADLVELVLCVQQSNTSLFVFKGQKRSVIKSCLPAHTNTLYRKCHVIGSVEECHQENAGNPSQDLRQLNSFIRHFHSDLRGILQKPLLCCCLLKAPMAFFMIISGTEMKQQLTRAGLAAVTCPGDPDTVTASRCVMSSTYKPTQDLLGTARADE